MIDHIKTIFHFSHVVSSDLVHGDLEAAIKAIERNGVAIKGNIETKHDDPSFKSRNVELRTRLDLYANILHCVSIPTIPTRHKNIDIVLIRENTEGEYSGLEHETLPGIVESIKVAKEMAKADYPQIEFEAMIVDNACMQMVGRRLHKFTTRSLRAESMSTHMSLSAFPCYFEQEFSIQPDKVLLEKDRLLRTQITLQGTRNTGTSLAGKDLANPTAFIRASVDMLRYYSAVISETRMTQHSLRYLGCDKHANMISDALWKTLVEQKVHTRDVGGTHKASEVVKITLENIDNMMRQLR
ncbi:unnamed protein product [Strongylus vulgaris]|uniref:Isopropylmalate dehydrogenase-like domain-containing protein n=1 Tax=Strongylus vulgaris TaxID=40348 RepID=A0A3P7L820_STRVU|nr:unnamed protein product [Strongylus vulgaris]